MKTVFMPQYFAMGVLLLALGSTFAFGQTDGDREAELLSVPKVEMPSEAEKAGIGGEVRVLVSVDEDGRVTSAEVSGPDWVCPSVNTPAVTALRTAAKDAAMNAKFTPATRGGKAEVGSKLLYFHFTATKPETSGGLAAEKNPNKKPKMVVAGVVGGRAKHLPKPAYPAAAKAVRASGTVGIKVLIEEDGSMYSAEVVSGHPLLRSAARLAACNAKFDPTKLRGVPVKVSGIIMYNFVP
jgi:TonB family protein